MNYKIAVVAGDGIGQEIITETMRVMNQVGKVFGHQFQFEECCAATAAVEKFGDPLPEESLRQCKESDAVLLGNIWLDTYLDLPKEKRPNYALIALRKNLALKTNIRPAFILPSVSEFCPLKESVITDGMDILMLRDLAGGMIMSEKYRGMNHDGREAFDKEYYNEEMIKVTARNGFEFARQRRKKVTSLDKAVILESSKLWREIVTEVGSEYPDVQLEHMYVDDAAKKIIENPSNFDVIVTTNVFGDIISDEITALVGATNLLPAASLNSNGKGIFETNQLHNHNREIVGKNMANPIGSILSGAMMLSYSFQLEQEGKIIEKAVADVLAAGYATPDIYSPGKTLVGTKELGTKIADHIGQLKKEFI
ncbi:3-isopropylmalate dehydrogenase [Paenibacillus sp. Aloe-11]|uniref:3-isopropylmalate dehydrogenase n=1 Tax=Paenibacillus sp. Aloe-11 TaxID=1050222 RepID=UPI00024F022C|nr:3-isopropylmalate dehydrogenase [Paenibacillus sp. Aloe-11]EHS59225.1 3-isopropylmalate dehydrogenase [Paenibacillus sp. Aloe-11]